jgi:hypothetical protein
MKKMKKEDEERSNCSNQLQTYLQKAKQASS